MFDLRSVELLELDALFNEIDNVSCRAQRVDWRVRVALVERGQSGVEREQSLGVQCFVDAATIHGVQRVSPEHVYLASKWHALSLAEQCQLTERVNERFHVLLL